MVVSISFLCFLVASICLLAAAAHDLAVRTIPNGIPVVLAAVAIVERGYDHRLMAAAIIGIVVFAVGILIWLGGLMGGGDVKLLAACAILIPPELSPQLAFFFRTVLFGGGLAIAYLLASVIVSKRIGPRPSGCFRRMARAEQWRIKSRASLPYAVAIAAGAFSVLLPIGVP
jgi:prepilin peptidase CpaA